MEMVCNCSYALGYIDYGIPLSYKTPDNRTSSQIATKFIPPIDQPFYRVPTWDLQHGRLQEPKVDMYKTDSSKTYVYSCPQLDPNGKANCARKFWKTHYMVTQKEKMFKNPLPPGDYPITTYKCDFGFKEKLPTMEKMDDLETQAICRLSSLGKSEQPRIRIEDRGALRHLDPYVTTTKISYIPFSPDQIYASRQHFITIYEAKNNAELKTSNIKKPLNDELLFKKVIGNRIIPKIIYRVPFTGKTTEFKSSYKPPTKHCLANRTIITDVYFPDSIPDPSRRQTLAAPNMYSTEYCHIGTGKQIRAAVNYKQNDKKHVFKHEPCSDDNKLNSV